jgi:hypothetical protein
MTPFDAAGRAHPETICQPTLPAVGTLFTHQSGVTDGPSPFIFSLPTSIRGPQGLWGMAPAFVAESFRRLPVDKFLRSRLSGKNYVGHHFLRIPVIVNAKSG